MCWEPQLWWCPGVTLSPPPVFYPHSREPSIMQIMSPLLTISHCLSVHLILGYESKLLRYETLHSSSSHQSLHNDLHPPVSTLACELCWNAQLLKLPCVRAQSLSPSVLPDSLRPHVTVAAPRLLCRWDFLGKYTEVGGHFSFSRDLSDPRIEATCPTWRILYHCVPPPMQPTSNPFIPKCQVCELVCKSTVK